jgi:hypothetical protein
VSFTPASSADAALSSGRSGVAKSPWTSRAGLPPAVAGFPRFGL